MPIFDELFSYVTFSYLQKLHQIARTNAGTQLIAKKPMNIIRNRYRDVLPSKYNHVCECECVC